MGMFDTVHCEYPLPEARHQDLEYQTKSLECLLDRFTITRDGRLVRKGRALRGLTRPDHEWPVHGDVEIHTSDDSSGEREWISYTVRFTNGRVDWIRPSEEVQRERPQLEEEEGLFSWPDDWKLPAVLARKEPAAAESEVEGDAEAALLAALKRDRAALVALLERCSGPWGYEDPIYRFYHQSFEVYALQGQTERIVRALEALSPSQPLNPWFLEIVRAGTGKTFSPADNARWTETTRPIVEAFFHARYFLEVAVRYSDLETAPTSLPSGYAALLELYGLR